MRRVAVMLVAGLLAACSKQEPAAPVAMSVPPAPKDAAPPKPGEGAPDGGKLFLENCATCHMADGSGVPFLQPPIKGSAWISNPDPQLLLTLILRGSAVLGEASQAFENDMAPQAHLGDADIAALATFVRQRFATPPAEGVSPDEVAIARNRPGLP